MAPMRILISNDDGYKAEGLQALRAALATIAVMERDDYREKARRIGAIVEQRFAAWAQQYAVVGE